MDQNRVSISGFGMFCPDSDPKPDSNLLYLHGLFDIKNVADPGQNNLDLYQTALKHSDHMIIRLNW